MFEQKININMDAKGYIEYLKYKKNKKHHVADWFNKQNEQKKLGITIIFCSVLGIFLIAIMIQIFFFPQEYTSNIPFLISLTWEKLIKYGLIVSFPFILVSWILHGVQLRLLA